MNSVLVMMSTYNGKKNIRRQVDSILAQEDVIVNIFIRDDGSEKDTIDELKEIVKENQESIFCIYGDNVGYKKSFMELIYSANLNYDYYAFSDQDDIWFKDKLSSCISLNKENAPTLIHCNCLSVDQSLKLRVEQEKRVPAPHSHKMAIATEYFQGCGMIWTKELMRVIQSYRPLNNELSHDYWVGIIGYYFGYICFCHEPKFYHIRYENNESSDGDIRKGRINRIKSLFNGKSAYMNPSEDLINGFSDKLLPADLSFLKDLSNYKKSFKSKIKILSDPEFKKPTKAATLLLKFGILINRF